FESLRVMVLVVPAAGCVLLVPNLASDGVCDFEGETACATCIRAHCQPAVNACCGQRECGGYGAGSDDIAAVDACGRGEKDACAKGLEQSSSAAGKSVATCVAAECSDTCLEGSPLAVPWTCEAPRTH